MTTLKATLRVLANTRQFSRSAITRSAGNVPEGYAKIKLTQAKFQKADGLPVHLKGGMFDKILFGTTVVLCAIGIGMTAEMIYTLANPPKLD